MRFRTEKENTMTSREIRNRKDRNQRIIWAMQDALGLTLLIAIATGGTMILWGFQ